MPPFQPRLENDRDLTNFPPEFTDEPVYLTPDDDRIIEKIDQSEFEGFEYVNPLLMTFDDCVWHNSNCQFHPNYSMQVRVFLFFSFQGFKSFDLRNFHNLMDELSKLFFSWKFDWVRSRSIESRKNMWSDVRQLGWNLWLKDSQDRQLCFEQWVVKRGSLLTL